MRKNPQSDVYRLGFAHQPAIQPVRSVSVTRLLRGRGGGNPKAGVHPAIPAPPRSGVKGSPRNSWVPRKIHTQTVLNPRARGCGGGGSVAAAPAPFAALSMPAPPAAETILSIPFPPRNETSCGWRVGHALVLLHVDISIYKNSHNMPHLKSKLGIALLSPHCPLRLAGIAGSPVASHPTAIPAASPRASHPPPPERPVLIGPCGAPNGVRARGPVQRVQLPGVATRPLPRRRPRGRVWGTPPPRQTDGGGGPPPFPLDWSWAGCKRSLLAMQGSFSCPVFPGPGPLWVLGCRSFWVMGPVGPSQPERNEGDR